MDDLIPPKDKRIRNSDEIGEEMYKKNWRAILNGLEAVEPRFASFVREIPYGSVFPRKTLSLPYREVAAITALTQLNLKSQLKSHIIAARNVGITDEEIKELFLHIAMFIGFPLCLDGLRVAQEVFEGRKNQN